jgi:hypothetical protein
LKLARFRKPNTACILPDVEYRLDINIRNIIYRIYAEHVPKSGSGRRAQGGVGGRKKDS